MATIEIIQSFDRSATGDISAADVPTCRVEAGFRHAVVSAKVVLQSLVTSNGVNTIQLRYSDPGGSRGGAAASVALNNTTLANPAASTRLEYFFDLLGFEALWADAPKDREYFVNLHGTHASDTLNEPRLVMELRRL